MLSTDWKSSYGHTLQIGLRDGDAVGDLNLIAEWLIDNRQDEVWCIDDLKRKNSRVLGSLVQGKRDYAIAPPTVAGNVRIYPECPELPFRAKFIHVAVADPEAIAPVLSAVQTGTILYGTLEACAAVMEGAECEAQPLFHSGDLVVVRIA